MFSIGEDSDNEEILKTEEPVEPVAIQSREGTSGEPIASGAVVAIVPDRSVDALDRCLEAFSLAKRQSQDDRCDSLRARAVELWFAGDVSAALRPQLWALLLNVTLPDDDDGGGGTPSKAAGAAADTSPLSKDSLQTVCTIIDAQPAGEAAASAASPSEDRLRRLQLLLAPFAFLPGSANAARLHAFVRGLVAFGLAAGLDERALGRQTRLFRAALQYVDPALCKHMNEFGLPPELLALEWLGTMFSSSLPPHSCLLLWDAVLVAGVAQQLGVKLSPGGGDGDETTGGRVRAGPAVTELPFFLCLSLLLHHRSAVLGAKNPDDLAAAAAGSLDTDGLIDLCAQASQLSVPGRLPACTRLQAASALPKTSSHRSAPAVPDWPYEADESVGGLRVPLREVVNQPTPNYFVVDIRDLAEYNAGRLTGTGYHMPPSVADNALEFSRAVQRLQPMHGTHFCFFGGGRSAGDGDASRRAAQFVREGFPNVSVVQGGYLFAHQQFSAGKTLLLTQHDQKRCAECSGLAAKRAGGAGAGAGAGFAAAAAGRKASARITSMASKAAAGVMTAVDVVSTVIAGSDDENDREEPPNESTATADAGAVVSEAPSDDTVTQSNTQVPSAAVGSDSVTSAKGSDIAPTSSSEVSRTTKLSLFASKAAAGVMSGVINAVEVASTAIAGDSDEEKELAERLEQQQKEARQREEEKEKQRQDADDNGSSSMAGSLFGAFRRTVRDTITGIKEVIAEETKSSDASPPPPPRLTQSQWEARPGYSVFEGRAVRTPDEAASGEGPPFLLILNPRRICVAVPAALPSDGGQGGEPVLDVEWWQTLDNIDKITLKKSTPNVVVIYFVTGDDEQSVSVERFWFADPKLIVGAIRAADEEAKNRRQRRDKKSKSAVESDRAGEASDEQPSDGDASSAKTGEPFVSSTPATSVNVDEPVESAVAPQPETKPEPVESAVAPQPETSSPTAPKKPLDPPLTKAEISSPSTESAPIEPPSTKESAVEVDSPVSAVTPAVEQETPSTPDPAARPADISSPITDPDEDFFNFLESGEI